MQIYCERTLLACACARFILRHCPHCPASPALPRLASRSHDLPEEHAVERPLHPPTRVGCVLSLRVAWLEPEPLCLLVGCRGVLGLRGPRVGLPAQGDADQGDELLLRRPPGQHDLPGRGLPLHQLQPNLHRRGYDRLRVLSVASVAWHVAWHPCLLALGCLRCRGAALWPGLAGGFDVPFTDALPSDLVCSTCSSVPLCADDMATLRGYIKFQVRTALCLSLPLCASRSPSPRVRHCCRTTSS